MTITAKRTLQDILLGLDDVEQDTGTTQRITAPVGIGFGYTLTLSNSWGQNLVEWDLHDQRDGRRIARGYASRREGEDVKERFRIREDNDYAEVWNTASEVDYVAAARALLALRDTLGAWLDHG